MDMMLIAEMCLIRVLVIKIMSIPWSMMYVPLMSCSSLTSSHFSVFLSKLDLYPYSITRRLGEDRELNVHAQFCLTFGARFSDHGLLYVVVVPMIRGFKSG